MLAPAANVGGAQVWKEAWRAVLGALDEKSLLELEWEETFIDATFVNAERSETSLAQSTVEEVAKLAVEDPACWPMRTIADKGCNSDELRAAFTRVDTQLLAPHRSNRSAKTRSNDGRCARRYKRHRIVERSFAWLNGFRRLIVRHERHPLM